MEFILVIVACVGVFFLIKKIRGTVSSSTTTSGGGLGGGGGDGNDGSEVKNPNQI